MVRSPSMGLISGSHTAAGCLGLSLQTQLLVRVFWQAIIGATGEATVGAGLGANVLLGGSNPTVALQPLSRVVRRA